MKLSKTHAAGSVQAVEGTEHKLVTHRLKSHSSSLHAARVTAHRHPSQLKNVRTATHARHRGELNKNVSFNKLCCINEEGSACQPLCPAVAQHSPSLSPAILPLNSEMIPDASTTVSKLGV